MLNISIKSNLSHPAKQFVSNNLFRVTCAMKPLLNDNNKNNNLFTLDTQDTFVKDPQYNENC